MKRGTEKILRCPFCKSASISLTSIGIENSSEIREGNCKCDHCGTPFPIQHGIIYMLDELPTKTRKEISQWEIFAASEGCLDPPDEYLDLLPSPEALKYVPGDTITWWRHQGNFNSVLEGLNLAGKKVLDIGAGRCWSTKHLSLRGAECFASDVLVHPKIGLGAADVLMSRNSIYFERIAGDMSNIPFQNEIFDVVFSSGALHHTLDLSKTISEISRVLKKNGLLILANEACGNLLTLREDCKMEGDQSGINEHSYRITRYFAYLLRSKFRSFKIIPTTGFFDQNDNYFGGAWITRLVNWNLHFFIFYLILRGGVLNLIAKKGGKNGRNKQKNMGNKI